MFSLKKAIWVLGCIPWVSQAQSDSSRFRHQQLQELVVSGISVKQQQPITQLTMRRDQIQTRYYGADIPSLIQFTPAINTYSDNGTGMGYSYFRLRGMDQTRINTTINGIPVNDPENQGVFFNNIADLASSAEQIQIIRGVGSSTNGTSSFGGSVNILTRNVSDESGVQVSLGGGSYGSKRATVEMQSGLLHKHVAFYGRFSSLATDGYRYHSGSQIHSYQFSAVYYGKKDVLKFNTFGGFAQSELSYAGVSKATLDADYRANDFTHGESDAFNQHFFQIQYNRQLNSAWDFCSSAYFVRGNAPKFQYLFPATPDLGFDYFNMSNPVIGTDTIKTIGDMMTSYRVDQWFYGAFANWHYRANRLDWTAGLHANSFISDHFMEINYGQYVPNDFQQNHRVYFNTGYKKEISAMMKWNYAIHSSLNWFGDIQVRNAQFSYKGHDMEIRKEAGTVEDMNWLFVNPKTGLTYLLSSTQQLYASVAMNHREPTRFDYFQDDFATADVTKQNAIQPESVIDYEFGYRWRSTNGYVQVNGFYMDFQNQIVGTGRLNTFGYPITTNVKSSYRTGIETELEYRFTDTKWWFSHTGCFSTNKLKDITLYYMGGVNNDSIVGIHHASSTALLSPGIISTTGIGFKPNAAWEFFASMRYVGMQYLDNSESKSVSAPEYQLLDLRIRYHLPVQNLAGKAWISVQANNLLDTKYCPSGTVQSGTNTINSSTGAIGTTPLYFAGAGRNYFVTLHWSF